MWKNLDILLDWSGKLMRLNFFILSLKSQIYDKKTLK